MVEAIVTDPARNSTIRLRLPLALDGPSGGPQEQGRKPALQSDALPSAAGAGGSGGVGEDCTSVLAVWPPSACSGTLVAMDEGATLHRIHTALLEEAVDGIERTAGVYAFGAFQLAGALLDTVSCLATRRGTRAGRFVRFVVAYFPAAYQKADLPRQLYQDLRCHPLHNYSTIRLLLMDGQDEALNLTEYRGRTIIRLQNLLCDLRVALVQWWQDVERDPTHRQAVLAEQRERPIVQVETIEIGLTLPASLPAQFPPGASAYGGVALASGGLRLSPRRDGNG